MPSCNAQIQPVLSIIFYHLVFFLPLLILHVIIHSPFFEWGTMAIADADVAAVPVVSQRLWLLRSLGLE